MKAILVAAASAMAIAPALTSGASATPPVSNGSWSFADYTPDPGSLAADNAFHTATGASITSYCHGSRVPSAPQDVNAHALKVGRPAVLQVHLDATGAWGLDVTRSRGTSLAGVTTTRAATNGADLSVRLRPGQYVVQACNLGGAPTAQVSYRLG